MMPPGSHGRHQNVQEAADGVGGDLGIWDVWGFLGEGRAGWAITLGLIILKNVVGLEAGGASPGAWHLGRVNIEVRGDCITGVCADRGAVSWRVSLHVKGLCRAGSCADTKGWVPMSRVCRHPEGS